MTLAEFLLARIAEDEAAARAECGCGDHDTWGRKPDCPERVLAECEAKRRIVELDDSEAADSPPYAGAIEDALRAIAAVYADHPAYDEAWRP